MARQHTLYQRRTSTISILGSCWCGQGITPRHERFDFVREMGMAEIAAVFDGTPLPEHLTFVFPERHMSVREQQAFMLKLKNHPDSVSGHVKTMDMLTSCALMVSSFDRLMINILQWEDDEKFLEKCK